MLFDDNQTIAAISTPSGEGGIAIIRVSGHAAIAIVDHHFKGKQPLSQVRSWHAYHGRFYFQDVDNSSLSESLYDEVILTVFRAPRSYTREDVVEISCHGGRYLAQRILSAIINSGARLAQPGEFTFKAFMNGRIDLSQAEAIADLIKAQNDLAIQNSTKQLEGYLSQEIGALRTRLMDTVALLELELDFAEEDLEFASRGEVKELLGQIESQIQKLIGSFERAKLVRDGAKVVLMGKPNVGKSSILNAMLRENRAIVTDIPGTTRDVLEEQISIHGIAFRLLDTAGISESKDPIEMEGIRRTNQNIGDADILLAIFDGSQPIDAKDERILQTLRSLRRQKTITGVINKIDLSLQLQIGNLRQFLPQMELLSVSAKNNEGISELGEYLVSVIRKNYQSESEQVVVTNLRHQKALTAALTALIRAQDSLEINLSSEFIASDLRIVLDHLGAIVGAISSEDVLNHIFSRFCIGK